MTPKQQHWVESLPMWAVILILVFYMSVPAIFVLMGGWLNLALAVMYIVAFARVTWSTFR